MDEFLDKYIYPYTAKYIGHARLDKNGLPLYTKQEELANTITHAAGILIGIGMIVASVLYHHSHIGMVGGIIYGITLIILYLASSAYHGTSPGNVALKKLLRLFDHCSIFVLIAGTCTPFVLRLIYQLSDESEWGFYAVIWTLAIGGIALLCVNLKQFSSVATLMYVAMSVLLVTRSGTLSRIIDKTGIWLFVCGGGIYLIGLLFYGLGSKRTWMHTIFHVFCLAGSVLHCICVGAYVI